jgi:hypothetical protein
MLGFSTRQKCKVALRMLAYGGAVDFMMKDCVWVKARF